MSDPGEGAGHQQGPIGIYNRQSAIPVSKELHDCLLGWAHEAWARVPAHALAPLPVPEDQLEITLLDDRLIAKVHMDYLNIAGATDVITFEHGEILISLETAARQALAFGDGFEREILRYIVHGMLHLAGHEDGDPASQALMEAAQEKIVAAICPAG
jgi:probable rRNA maturation factor